MKMPSRGNLTMRIRCLMSLIPIVFLWTSSAQAREEPIRVVTTLSFLRYLAEEIGGERVTAVNLASPLQDPHYIQPKPTLMRVVRKADLFIEVGLQLELWAQRVVDGSGNLKIQSGRPGRVIASERIRTLELPMILSKEWGDIHPYGNPHVWLDPIHVKQVARNICSGLQRVDPGSAGDYEERLAALLDRLDLSLFGRELVDTVGSPKLNRLSLNGTLFGYLKEQGLLERLGGWLGKSRPLWGRKIVTYHKTWIYFANRFGLVILDEIEEFPGIAPPARHRDHLVDLVRRKSVRALLVSHFYRMRPAEYISERTGAVVISAPIDVGGEPGMEDYFLLIDSILDRLLEAFSTPERGSPR